MSLASHSLAAVSLAGGVALAGFVPPVTILPGGGTETPSPQVYCLNSDLVIVGTGLTFDDRVALAGLESDNLIENPQCSE